MATHSSILAWEIPWTEEPGGLQAMRLQRVRLHFLQGKLGDPAEPRWGSPQLMVWTGCPVLGPLPWFLAERSV